MSTRTIKATKGLITDILKYTILIILQVILAPIILKVSGQETLGAYSIVMQIIGFGLVLDLGVGVALTRYLSQSFGANDNFHRFKEIFNVGRYFILLTNVLMALVIITVSVNIGRLITVSPQVLSSVSDSLLILSVWTIARTPLILYSNSLLASQNMAIANIIGIIGGVCRLLLSIGLIYYEFGLIGLVLANIMSECLTLLLKRYYFNKFNPFLKLNWSKPNIKLMREITAFGITYWGVNVAIVLTLGSDSILIGHLYGAATVAVFYTTKITSLMVIQLIFRISDNAGPAMNELISLQKFDEIRRAYFKIIRYSMLVTFPFAIGIVCFNEGIISAWIGVDQYAGHLMSFSLAAYAITQVINHINAMIVVATGNMNNWMSISIGAGIAAISLAYLLGKLLGMQWVMFAIAFMELPVFFFLMRRSLSSIGITFGDLWRHSILPAIQVSTPLIFLSLGLSTTNTVDNLVTLLAGIIGFVALWAAGFYCIGISVSERGLIKNKIWSILHT